MLLALAGLPGTGKSTLARALVEALHVQGRSALILNKDHVRASLFSPSDIAYTREQDDLCVEIMLQVAGYLLARVSDRLVILDGRTFSRPYQVRRVTDAASAMGVPVAFIECRCAAETAMARLARDQAEGSHQAQDRGPELYQRVAASAQPLLVLRLIVDTDDDMADNILACLAYLEIHAAWGTASQARS